MNTSEFSIRALALAILASLVMTGCTVGPNFERPSTSTPEVFDRTQSAQAPSRPSNPRSVRNGGRCSTIPC